jgi:hypothetical protein
VKGLVPNRSPKIKNQGPHVLLQQMGMIYFKFWVSGVLALLLSIFSEVLFPECTKLYHMSRPSTTRVSTSYLFGALENS